MSFRFEAQRRFSSVERRGLRNQCNDTVTTNSLITRLLKTTVKKFKELKDAISRKQNAAIKEHHTEFRNVNQWFDNLNSRLLQTFTFCKDASRNVLELRQETTENIIGIRQDAIENVQEFRHCFMEMQQMIQSLTTRLDDAMSRKFSSSDSISTTSAQSEEDNMSCHSTATTEKQKLATSPRKKLDKRNKQKEKHDNLRTIKQNQNPSKPPPNQDKSAQYKEDSTPDAGATWPLQTSHNKPLNQLDLHTLKLQKEVKILLKKVDNAKSIKGLTYSATGQDYDYYMSYIASIDSDITGMTETNSAWQHHHLKTTFTKSVK